MWRREYFQRQGEIVLPQVHAIKIIKVLLFGGLVDCVAERDPMEVIRNPDGLSINTNRYLAHFKF